MRFFKNIVLLILLFFMLQGCKAYKSSSLEQASNTSGYYKVTMLNGDEFIYQAIEKNNEDFMGISTTRDGEKISTKLEKENIQSVQMHNKNSSNFFKISGIIIVLTSIFAGITML